MPFAFFKINGRVSGIYFEKNGSVLAPYMMVDVPEINHLMEMNRDELKDLLTTANLRLTNFTKIDKQEICRTICDNWDQVTERLALRYMDTFTYNQPEQDDRSVQDQGVQTISEVPQVVELVTPPSQSVEKTVKVIVSKGDGELDLHFELNPDVCLVSDLYECYADKTKVPAEQVCFFSGIKKMEDYRRLREYVENGKILVTVQPVLLGGGTGRATRKSFLKSKDEKLQDVAKRSEKFIINNHFDNEEDVPKGEMPIALNSLVQPIKDKMALVKNKLENGETILVQALSQCSDQQLKKLYDIYERNKNHTVTEEKLMR